MCVALIKKPGVDLPSEQILSICFKNNPDGAGFALFRNQQIYLYKGFFTFKGFWKAIKNINPTKEEAMLIHFRVATHGKINIENCHPFPIVDKFSSMVKPVNILTDTDVLVHNGKLDITCSNNQYSDSMHFAKEIVGLDRKRFSDIIEMAIAPTSTNKRGNRVAILTKDGYIEKYGVGWIEDGGIWYSNDSYKEFSLYKGHDKTKKNTVVYYNDTNKIGYNTTAPKKDIPTHVIACSCECNNCRKTKMCYRVNYNSYGKNSGTAFYCKDCMEILNIIKCDECAKYFFGCSSVTYSTVTKGQHCTKKICSKCQKKAVLI